MKIGEMGFKSTFRKNLAIAVLVLTAASAIAYVFSQFVPYNMDEFSYYHPIICHHYKFNGINAFRENCKGYDLSVLNLRFLPLRSYTHIGAFASLYYYPVFFIFRHPISSRFFGALSLLIQGLLISKFFNIKKRYAIAFFLFFFPYFFQHLADTGNLAYMTVSIFILYFLFERWMHEKKLRCSLAIAIVIFFGIWSKLVYIWLLPGIALMFLSIMIGRNARQHAKKILMQSSVSLFLLLFLLSLLFFSKDRYGYHYFELVSGSNPPNLKILADFDELSSHQVFRAMANPLEATQRIFSVNEKISMLSYIYGVSLILFIPLCLMILLVFFYKKRKCLKQQALKVLLLYLAFIITAAIVFITPGTWAMHHIIPAFPFLILGIFGAISALKSLFEKEAKAYYINSIYNIPRIIIFSLFLFFMLFNLYFFISFSKQPLNGSDDWSKIKLNGILKDKYLASNYFYVVVDWGMYYYQGLYGPDEQSVIYIGPLNSMEQMNNLKKLAEDYNRKLLFIYTRPSESDMELIQKSFDLKKCSLVDDKWVWNILLEKDDSLENPCFMNK